MRKRHDFCIAGLDKLDAEIAEPYNGAPALPVTGGDLQFVRDRYEVFVRPQTYLVMAVADFLYKSDPEADRDWSLDEAPDMHV